MKSNQDRLFGPFASNLGGTLEGLALLALLVVMGCLLVPAHWTSIWMDVEFTGWVAPIAKRMAEGQILYANGAHSPMPPLPVVLMRLLHGDQVTWLDESRLNFLFKCGTILLAYITLSRWLPRPIPFAAAVATVGYFFALPKTIVYDAMAQFMVAGCIALIGSIAHRCCQDPGRRADRGLLVALGAVLSALVLTKQSTALGVVASSLLVLALLPGNGKLEHRAARLAWVLAGVACGTAVLLAVCAPSVSISGMVHDVFLHGAEPKGGASRLGPYLRAYALSYLQLILFGTAVLTLAFGLWRLLAPESLHQVVTGRLQFPLPGLQSCLILCAVAFCLIARPELAPRHDAWIRQLVISTPFALLTGSIAVGLSRRGSKNIQLFGLCSLVALSAAVTHNLSVNYLRITYDNNPVILLAITALLVVLARIFSISHPSVPLPARYVALSVAFLAVILQAWSGLVPELALAAQCSVQWPEVPYLKDAKLRPEADGMRSLVAVVRRNTAPGETVLLLPDDPNVEAWWDRPRPKLSSAIIFSDQYWPQFVDSDLQRLKANPPTVIVIGPRNFWRGFSSQWRGADGQLIDRISKELLPGQYRLIAAQPILHEGKDDFMDVYRLR